MPHHLAAICAPAFVAASARSNGACYASCFNGRLSRPPIPGRNELHHDHSGLFAGVTERVWEIADIVRLMEEREARLRAEALENSRSQIGGAFWHNVQSRLPSDVETIGTVRTFQDTTTIENRSSMVHNS
jgi:hypothetical protein